MNYAKGELVQENARGKQADIYFMPLRFHPSRFALDVSIANIFLLFPIFNL
jgi:hypothetical protein